MMRSHSLLNLVVLAITTGFIVFFSHSCGWPVFESVHAQSLDATRSLLAEHHNPFESEKINHYQPHPLPPTLANWEDSSNSGDYFAQLDPVDVGALIWSEFPVKVYIDAGSQPASMNWTAAALAAVDEWTIYLPLTVIDQPDMADIKILRQSPPLRLLPNGELDRARSAETRYELYLKEQVDSAPILAHRCTILLSPTQSGAYVQSAIRHELGHALGIWGHSPVATDVLYFSQVRHPPPISVRDVNTLKRVYEQPTRLGWPILGEEIGD